MVAWRHYVGDIEYLYRFMVNLFSRQVLLIKLDLIDLNLLGLVKVLRKQFGAFFRNLCNCCIEFLSV